METAHADHTWGLLRENEQRAGRWFAALSGRAVLPHDIGPGEARVDFLVGEQGELGALEITSHIDQAWLQRDLWIDRLGSDGTPHWEASVLSRYWSVGLEEPDVYRANHGTQQPLPSSVHNRLALLLEPFERDPRWCDGEDIISVPMQWGSHAASTLRLHREDPETFPPPEPWMALVAELMALGVCHAMAFDRTHRGGRIFVSCGGSGAVGPALVTAAVEAAYSGKSSKLRKQEGQRHLWVWVGPGEFLTSYAMESADLPTSPPDAPGLTDAWVATGAGHVWHWNQTRGWRVASRSPPNDA